MKRILFLIPLLAIVLLSSCRGEERGVAVAGVDLSERSLTLLTGDERLLTATVRPRDAANPQVTWSSGNPAVATVTEGLVKALSVGTASITVKTVDGGFTDSALITVLERPVPVTGVSLSEKEVTIVVGNTYSGLKATVAPTDATNKTIQWAVSDPEVLQLQENGDGSISLTGLSEADAFVTVTTKDGGFSDICTVYIRDIHAESVSIDGGSFTLSTHAQKQLHATVSPEGAVNASVAWSSSDPAVASVDETGLVTGNKAGTAIITVTTVDGGWKDKVTVTVQDVPVTGVSIQGDAEITLAKDATRQLTAVIAPADATHQEVTWCSSVPAVATVSETGLVKALSKGVTTITVKTTEGSFSATVKVNVKVPSTDIGAGGDFGGSDYGEYN